MANYTSINQSKKLLELGLSPKSADMNWHELPNIGMFVRVFPYVHNNGATEGILPCWSVGALLEVMPVILKQKYRVWLTPHSGGYSCTYGDYSGTFHAENEKTAIYACYNMVVWLLENNYIKKGD